VETCHEVKNGPCHMWAGMAQGGITSPVLFNVHVNMPLPSRHTELHHYADDTTVIATSHQPGLLLRYLEIYLYDLEWWLREWRIANNVSC
jgi:hypothetical protein